jgi:hypothetical protein
MAWATVSGSEIIDRCPAFTSVMWALACWAMNVSPAGGMTRSAVPILAKYGMVFQAGTPDGSLKALPASGRPAAARHTPDHRYGADRPDRGGPAPSS